MNVCRKLFNLAAVLSLALCMAACALWARSYWVSERVIRRRADGERWVGSRHGQIMLGLALGEGAVRSSAPRWEYVRDLHPEGLFFLIEVLVAQHSPGRIGGKWGGFAWYETRNSYRTNALGTAPIFSIALATAVLPLAWTSLHVRSRLRHRRRIDRNLCLTCGYDLRATPPGEQGGRCPECGTSSSRGSGIPVRCGLIEPQMGRDRRG